jgi:hypothetical protein
VTFLEEPPHLIPITTVVGTWGWRGLFYDPEHWSHPKSPLWSYLHTKGLAPRCDRNGKGFTWGTELTGHQLWRRLFFRKAGIKDWEVGAASFYDYHRPATVEYRHYLRGRNAHAICHSHGGNLPYIACSAYGMQINVLCTVSTPIRHDVLSVHGTKARERIGCHIHYWSKADRIQIAGQAGDGHIGLSGEHPFADYNIRLDEDAGHTGLLENPFLFDELLTFVEHVHKRHNNPGYLDRRLWVP